MKKTVFDRKKCVCPNCGKKTIDRHGYCKDEECSSVETSDNDLASGCDCPYHAMNRKLYTACHSCGKEGGWPAKDQRCVVCRKNNWSHAIHCDECDLVSDQVNYISHGFCKADGSDLTPDEFSYLCESCGDDVSEKMSNE